MDLAIDPCHKALDAIEQALSEGDSVHLDADAVDELILRQLGFSIQAFATKPREGLFQRIDASETKTRYPMQAHTLGAASLSDAMKKGKMREAADITFSVLKGLVDAARTHPNPAARRNSQQVAFNYVCAWMDAYMLCPDFSFEWYCGESGCTAIRAS